MIIPHEKLAADTLQALLEEFVTRDGTDYGEQEVGLDQKVLQVLQQLRRGDVVIFFDGETQSISVLSRDDVRRFEQLQSQESAPNDK